VPNGRPRSPTSGDASRTWSSQTWSRCAIHWSSGVHSSSATCAGPASRRVRSISRRALALDKVLLVHFVRQRPALTKSVRVAEKANAGAFSSVRTDAHCQASYRISLLGSLRIQLGRLREETVCHNGPEPGALASLVFASSVPCPRNGCRARYRSYTCAPDNRASHHGCNIRCLRFERLKKATPGSGK
jgi:hypothetical protein